MLEPEAGNPYTQPTIPYQADGRYSNPSFYQQQPYAPPANSYQRVAQAAKPGTPRMPKAEALALVEQFKVWLVAGSIVTFGVLTALVAGHMVGSTANANSSNNQTLSATNPSNTSPSSNGGFFPQQQGGNNFGNGGVSQQPVSGSHTS